MLIVFDGKEICDNDKRIKTNEKGKLIEK